MKDRKVLVKRILSIVLVLVIMLSAGFVNPVSCALTGTVTADAAAKTRVVVLDPGHGGAEKGACYYGMQEKALNLKIAKYCRDELNKYANVKVILTRTTDRSLTSGGTSADLLARSRVAQRNKADIFVCLHNNAFGEGESRATHGVRVYYQNESFSAWVGSQSKKLAQAIITRIAKCGLTNGGVRTRYSDDKSRRDKRGKKGDYYGVLYHNKKFGIPAVIVEHAFMSNEGDAAKLKKEAFLRSLGQADAAGIAQYLGLKKKSSKITGWYRNAGATYYYDRNGRKLTGWQTLSGKKYYFSVKNGCMLTGLQSIGGMNYYLDPGSGQMLKGFHTIGKKKYYFSTKDGHMLTGWQTIGGNKFYFSVKDGHMFTGRQWIGGRFYNFSAKGALLR